MACLLSRLAPGNSCPDWPFSGRSRYEHREKRCLAPAVGYAWSALSINCRYLESIIGLPGRHSKHEYMCLCVDISFVTLALSVVIIDYYRHML